MSEVLQLPQENKLQTIVSAMSCITRITISIWSQHYKLTGCHRSHRTCSGPLWLCLCIWMLPKASPGMSPRIGNKGSHESFQLLRSWPFGPQLPLIFCGPDSGSLLLLNFWERDLTSIGQRCIPCSSKQQNRQLFTRGIYWDKGYPTKGSIKQSSVKPSQLQSPHL